MYYNYVTDGREPGGTSSGHVSCMSTVTESPWREDSHKRPSPSYEPDECRPSSYSLNFKGSSLVVGSSLPSTSNL